MEPMFETITLSSIDPSKNRNRAYAVTITCSPGNESIYIVRQSWGREDSHRNEKLTYFEDITEVYTYARGLLMRRKNHGYEVVSISERFPEASIPHDLKFLSASRQLSLFRAVIAA